MDKLNNSPNNASKAKDAFGELCIAAHEAKTIKGINTMRHLREGKEINR